jgi:predicted lysophospholipase L1 biosynthesis ABC-type transport system permease subunit
VPGSLQNLAATRAVPPLLEVFLALLGILGLVHAIGVTAARRRLDVAILRCLGFARRNLAVATISHTLTVVVAGAVVGLPVGVLTGT